LFNLSVEDCLNWVNQDLIALTLLAEEIRDPNSPRITVEVSTIYFGRNFLENILAIKENDI
jgi:hypothetical protein